MGRLSLLAIVLGGCSEPDSIVPAPGRYTFTAEWFIAGFPEPATAEGELVIHTNPAPSETHISYTLTLNERNGPVAKTDQVTWSELNDWVLSSGTIGRAGPWILLPHLKRAGDSYECYGNAVAASLHGTPMDCAFTYTGSE